MYQYSLSNIILSKIFGFFGGVTSRPAMKMRDGILYSRSNLFGAILTLFAFFKQVWVDPEADTIRMERRIFWFWKYSWQVDFNDIRNIKYECKETSTGWDDYSGDYFTHDRYVIGLNLTDCRYKKMWTFSGNAGSSLLFQGSQGVDSLEYIEVLQFFTKKTLGPDHNRLRHQNQDLRPVWAKKIDAK